MITYQVKQKIFSLVDNYTIKDEDDTPLLQVKGKPFSFTRQLDLFDLEGTPLLRLNRKRFCFRPTYEIHTPSGWLATLKMKFSVLKKRVLVESALGEYEVEGSFTGHKFVVTRNGLVAAWVNKKMLTFGDAYGVAVEDGENPVFLLALCLVIDQMFHEKKD